MPFPFSFKFAVPGVPNPFHNGRSQGSAPGMPKSVDEPATQAPVMAGRVPRRPGSPCLIPSQPLARKRGWVPSSSEISVPTAVGTSTNGYLDTPAKYREMAQNAEGDEIEEMVAGESSWFPLQMLSVGGETRSGVDAHLHCRRGSLNSRYRCDGQNIARVYAQIS